MIGQVDLADMVADLTKSYDLTKKYLTLKVQQEDWGAAMEVIASLRTIKSSMTLLQEISKK